MNKAFVREPDTITDCCPRCGTKGEPVGSRALGVHLTKEQEGRIREPVHFCPSPQCPVAYFDALERTILAAELRQSIYPKEPTAPMCACFGLTRADIEADVAEGVVTRTKALLEKAHSPEARCSELAANGRSCVAYVQKYFLHCRAARIDPSS